MASSKPRKQRLILYTAPRHRMVKMMSAHLSPALREKYGRRSFPVRTGDTVKILSGDFKGVEGKVKAVDIKRRRVYVENVTDKKADGSNVDVPIRVSKVMITQLNLDDKYRKSKLEEGVTAG
ncbi:hypothetical protein HRbin01_01817 [archaeon HR01]|nr:hypothetical protein HRbin01_01817 [archaeon HR01]